MTKPAIARILFAALLSCWLAGWALPAQAAETPPATLTLDACNSELGITLDVWQYVAKVVNCVKFTIIKATLEPQTGLLPIMSDFLAPLVAVMMVFALILFGIKVIGGDSDVRKTIGFLLRLALVWGFFYNLGGLGGAVFQIMDELVCMVNMSSVQPIESEQTAMPGVLPGSNNQIVMFEGGVNQGCYPWNMMDKIAGKLFGFGEHALLANGLMGIVAASLFSSTMGILIFLTGFMALLDVLFMILRIMFIYLSAVLAAAFALIISPLVIPMALFYTQEVYFKKWTHMLITAVITPMFLFAFVGMFIGIYDLLIDRLIYILSDLDANGQPHFDAYWRLNQPKFSWLMPADPNLAQDFEDITRSQETGSSAVQSFVNPYLRRAMDTNMVVAPGVDFGEGGTKIIQQLVLGFASLWIFSTLMKSMIAKMPEIAKNIAGSALDLNYQSAPMEAGIKNAMNQARNEVNNNPTASSTPPSVSRRSL